jgi:hypothetical protein
MRSAWTRVEIIQGWRLRRSSGLFILFYFIVLRFTFSAGKQNYPSNATETSRITAMDSRHCCHRVSCSSHSHTAAAAAAALLTAFSLAAQQLRLIDNEVKQVKPPMLAGVLDQHVQPWPTVLNTSLIEVLSFSIK